MLAMLSSLVHVAINDGSDRGCMHMGGRQRRCSMDACTVALVTLGISIAVFGLLSQLDQQKK